MTLMLSPWTWQRSGSLAAGRLDRHCRSGGASLTSSSILTFVSKVELLVEILEFVSNLVSRLVLPSSSLVIASRTPLLLLPPAGLLALPPILPPSPLILLLSRRQRRHFLLLLAPFLPFPSLLAALSPEGPPLRPLTSSLFPPPILAPSLIASPLTPSSFLTPVFVISSSLRSEKKTVTTNLQFR